MVISNLQRTLTESGWGATRKKGSYFRGKYYRLASGRGKKKAWVAIGHKIIVAAYFIIKNKIEYKEPVQRDNPFSKERMAKNYFKKIEELGFKVSENHLVPTL
jgi:transposase